MTLIEDASSTTSNAGQTVAFLSGVARSGTTGAVYLLNKHPDIALGIERFKFTILRDDNADVELFSRERFFAFDPSDTNLLPHESVQFTNQYARLEKKYDSALVVGDKIPNLSTRYYKLVELFPDTRIVHIVREPTAVANSWERRAQDEDDRWADTADAERGISRWIVENSAALEFHNDFPDNILIVSYESFFSEDRRTLDRVCDFLGVGLAVPFQHKVRNAGAGRINGKKFSDLGPQPEYIDDKEWAKVVDLMPSLEEHVTERGLNIDEMLAVRRLPMRSKARRRFLAANVNQSIVTSLEIGALNVPTLLPNECDAKFLDWFSTEQLRARHEENTVVPPESIVPIDYVVSDTEFAPVVDQKFDLLIANHVIEHIPDLINWFGQLAQLSEPDGLLFLSVPDRRYTFDYFRPENDAVDIIEAHLEGLQRPSRFQIAKHLYYFTSLNSKRAWEGNIPEKLEPRMSFTEALERSEKLAEGYADVHCWIFTTETFQRIIEALNSSGHITWKIAAIEDVQEGENEFRVLMQRTA